MVKKKREELSGNISYFKEQFQDINRGIQLPESLKAENLLEKLEQLDQQDSTNSVEPVRKLKLFFGVTPQKWVATCGLVLVLGITSFIFLYGNVQSALAGDGILLQNSEATNDEATPQMAAYGIDELEESGQILDEAAPPSPQSAPTPDEGVALAKGRSAPLPELKSDEYAENFGQEEVQENAVPLPGSEAASPPKPNPGGKCEIPQPVYATSKEEIRTAIQSSLDSPKNLNQKISTPNPFKGEGIQNGEVSKINTTVMVNYDTVSGIITFLDKDENILSTLKVTPGSSVFAGENVLTVLQQSGDSVQVTLYDALNAEAPKKVGDWLQDGEFMRMTHSGGTFMLVTRVDINQTFLDENRFIPKVDGKPLEPADIELLYGSSEQTQYQVTTNFSIDNRQSIALLRLL